MKKLMFSAALSFSHPKIPTLSQYIQPVDTIKTF